jgi:hypothetical protein
VVDWRAPVAEPFYRATGRNPDGPGPAPPLRHPGPPAARHRGRAVRRGRGLGIGADVGGTACRATARSSPPSRRPHRSARRHRRHHPGRAGRDHPRRCPASWWCRAVPAPARPWWRCTGPPTCSTPTGSRSRARACWWSAPTAVPRYIEQVLPSLGEAGRRAGRAGRPSSRRSVGATTGEAAARVKGDLRMARCWPRRSATVSARCAATSCGRPRCPDARLTASTSARIVAAARRRYRRHNAGPPVRRAEVFEALAGQAHTELDPDTVRDRLRPRAGARGARAHVAGAHPASCSTTCSAPPPCSAWPPRGSPTTSRRALHRPRGASGSTTSVDRRRRPLLDEARALLGPPAKGGRVPEDDEIRTYGHIVVDEAQDLSPMQLRMRPAAR